MNETTVHDGRPVIFTDSSRNHITVERTPYLLDGDQLIIARLVDEPRRGYIARDAGNDWGDDACPDGPPCVTWFGAGERFADEKAALEAVSDDKEDWRCRFCRGDERAAACECV